MPSVRLAVLALLLAAPAAARTLTAGEGGEYPTFLEALRAARAGDTVHLAPGTYYECAVVAQRGLVIEGAGPATVLSDTACNGKALLVLVGGDQVVRDLTLARVRVPDMNGAGIRLESEGLTVERVRFDNDQVGVLAGDGIGGRIRIADCTFTGGGVAGERPSRALTIGAVDLLQVERSTFSGVKGGQIASAAAATVLTGNRIETGVEPGALPAVFAAGGTLLMRDNVLVLGPNAPQHDAAVHAAGTGAELRGNRLENGTGQSQRLLLDWMGASPVLQDNVVGPGDTLVSSAGLWRNRIGGVVRSWMGVARTVAGWGKRAVQRVLGR